MQCSEYIQEELAQRLPGIRLASESGYLQHAREVAIE